MPARAIPRPARRQSEEQRREWQDELVRRYQADPACQERVVEALMPLVLTLARRYKRGEEPLEDLVQVACVGLLKSLRGCDLRRGHFIAYAMPTITGELRRHYRDTGWSVHVPRGVQELAQRVTKAGSAFFADHGRHATAGELAIELGESVARIIDARIAGNGMRSTGLDLSAEDDFNQEAASPLLATTDDGFQAAEDRATLAVLLPAIEGRDRAILALRFHGGLSQREVGERLGISQMHVSRRLHAVAESMQRIAEAPAREHQVSD